MRKIAVILSGCGVFDGSEIHESVLTLLALAKAGVEYQCFSLNLPHKQVINHLTKQPMSETRNILIESARIARGNIKDIKEATVSDFDAAIFPGGMGAASNLCNFSDKGSECQVEEATLAFAKAMHEARKPLGFICIAPVMIPHMIGAEVAFTIGTDKEVASKVEAMGGKHKECSVNECVIDEKNKVVSTPAYMLAQSIAEVAVGVEKLVQAVLKLISH